MVGSRAQGPLSHPPPGANSQKPSSKPMDGNIFKTEFGGGGGG